MSHVFISHSHKNKAYAHELANSIQEFGFNVWIDDDIEFGTNWLRLIQEKLDSCGAFILIMTSQAYLSDWVQNELARAQLKNKPIFPLLLEGDTWLSVQSVQYVEVILGQLPPIGFYEALTKYLPTPSEFSSIQPQTLVVTFGVNIYELLDNPKLNEDIPKRVPEIYDWLEKDLAQRLIVFNQLDSPEPSQRDGETLSVRFSFKADHLEAHLSKIDFGWWDILEVIPYEDLYS